MTANNMKILFVCTANASRSAAAEVILRKMLDDEGIEGVEVESCGTKVPPDLVREDMMCRVAAENGYSLGGSCIQMTTPMLDSSDLVIAMTAHHRDEVTRLMSYGLWGRIHLFNEYAIGLTTDFPDPHFMGEDAYRTSFSNLEIGCRRILKAIKDNTLLK